VIKLNIEAKRALTTPFVSRFIAHNQYKSTDEYIFESFPTYISYKMNLEFLPNEIILDLFEYLSLFHLFHAFFGLNSRFNDLLCQQFQTFYLDFRLLSKTNFNYVCQNYVPSVIDRIISLQLSNDDDTPQQIELFLSRDDYQLRQFTHLQSISFSHFRSRELFDQIMTECSYLPSLANLSFNHGHIVMKESETQRFYNHIWSLSKVKYCCLNINFAKKNYFPNPTIVSNSIHYLIIQDTSCSLSTLTHLCQHTPNLKYLSIIFKDDSDEVELTPPILSIVRLRIVFTGSLNILEHLLNSMPNLYYLIWESYDIYINGNQWEEMIKRYLPKLEFLEMKMRFSSYNDDDGVSQLNQILDLFRTKFWIEEHQWFVRCHGVNFDAIDQLDFIDLFTIPYTFDNFSGYANCNLVQSTCPDSVEHLTLDFVNNLHYKSAQFANSVLSNARFPYIKYLSLLLPFHKEFFSIVSTLDQLTSLYVSVDKKKNLDNIQSQLQMVLDRAPRLYLLGFIYWRRSDSQLTPTEITSASVRELDLQGFNYDNDWRCFDEEQCSQLSRSPLGLQCETLLITVKYRRNIIQLVTNMPNLRALNVQCQDDTWPDKKHFGAAIRDIVVEWLHEQLPTTCTITRDSYLIHDIRIWIR
jgi:hypothetical protein